MMGSLTVLGAGSWGTTLAQVLALKGYRVMLWAREAEVRRSILEVRENTVFLPGIKLSANIIPCETFEESLRGSDFIVSVIPSHGVRAVFSEAKRHVNKGAVIVSATKGIEEGTMLTACGILRDVFGDMDTRLAVLSGPSFAKEVSLKLPTALCAASDSLEAAEQVQKAFSTPYFRVYTNSDVIGVELGGALKNVIAIAAGISDGLGLGHNARAALITRGLAEMTRLGVKMGAQPGTFAGLSGLGDLVLTCTGPLSRNYSVGVSIGKGEDIAEITKDMRMVAEGVKTSKGALELSRHNGVDMPITEGVYNVIYNGKAPKEAVMDLMTRELKGE